MKDALEKAPREGYAFSPISGTPLSTTGLEEGLPIAISRKIRAWPC